MRRICVSFFSEYYPRMRLSRYGQREWITITVIAIGLATVCIWLAWWWVIGVIAVFWVALAAFFRDPNRYVPTDLPQGTMLSPADGTISKVFRVEHHESTDGPALIVRIFLSVLDVHINRAPFEGEVIALKHTPGKYHDARSDISAKENESNVITLSITTKDGARQERIGVRQVSGAIARRIVCPLKVGDHLQRGEKFGMIKFGSTTELILPRPDDVEVLVAEGDTVKAGLTAMARLTPGSSPPDPDPRILNDGWERSDDDATHDEGVQGPTRGGQRADPRSGSSRA